MTRRAGPWGIPVATLPRQSAAVAGTEGQSPPVACKEKIPKDAGSWGSPVATRLCCGSKQFVKMAPSKAPPAQQCGSVRHMRLPP